MSLPPHNNDFQPASRAEARQREGRPLTRLERRHSLSSRLRHQRKRPRRPWVIVLVVAGVCAVVAVSSVFVGLAIGPLAGVFSDSAVYTETGEENVVVVIHEGDSGKDIGRTLAENNVVEDADVFYELLLAQPEPPVFQPGAYQMRTKMNSTSAMKALLDPANRLDNTVVIPEGTVAVAVYELLAEATKIPVQDYEAAARDVAGFGLPPEATTLEGFLFPDTYTFSAGTAAKEVLQTLVDQQLQQLDAHGVAVNERWQTIVMASVIEREAGLREDYYKVSRVFANRLNQGWNLESDATIAYNTQMQRVTTTDAERADPNNPYNTYIHAGLPVGPISNPGALAIDAAVHPAEGPWMFFVTWNLETGETSFSTTVQEHQAAADKWLRWMKDHPEYG